MLVKHTILSLLAAGALAATSSYAQGPLAASPFANQYARSYSSYKDLTGKWVDPLWGSLQPNDFGSRPVKFDLSGVRAINQVPAPGVHPRILFTPADLPDLRQRLKQTECGQAAWKNLMCWTEMMKGTYDENADYTKPDVWKGGFGGLHSRVPLFRLGVPRVNGHAYDHNPQAAAVWGKLVDGTATEFPEAYWNVFSLEAFRCLVEDDAQGARTLAKAVATALRLDQAKRAASTHEAGPPDQPIGAFQLAYTYDFIFNWLTPEQKKAMHDELALGSWHHDNYGTFNTATSSRSNWATFSYWLFEVLSVEDEPGFNELKVRGMYRGWRNLFTYGWFQSGATFEGEAKNQLGMDGIIPFAMRQQRYGFENLLGHPYLRAYATKFLPLSVIPTLDGFIKYDLLGGAHGTPMPPETLGLKYMMPGDKVLDWIYRCAVGEHYENVPDRCDGYRNDLLFFLAYCSDFDKSNNDPGKLNLGNTFFCGERALMMTRSSWDKEALMLNMHTRQNNGGHAFADRNSIMVAGAGRVWSPPGYASFNTAENSEVDIDHQTQEVSSPGRMADFVETPQATFAVGDASYAWGWKFKTLNKRGGYYTKEDVMANKVQIPPGWEPEQHTTNSFAYWALPYAYLNTPLFQSPDWILPNGALSPIVRQADLPVKMAFRTAGLVRGPHPYALVVDDIQKDATSHHYDWTLALEPDVQLVKVEKTGANSLDVFLTGPADSGLVRDPNKKVEKVATEMDAGEKVPAGQPMLLVRVINRTTSASDSDSIPKVLELPNQRDAKKYGPIRRLDIPAEAVAPNFKVLIYAYREGEPLPVTKWLDQKTAAVAWGNEVDMVSFTPSSSGKTNVDIKRNGTPIITVAKEVKPVE